ncbi:MAG: alpha/beta hydrolase [Proteobacteria bacterium]|nr:alpha/beta hydrolase [Pseudomonadota bacterium]
MSTSDRASPYRALRVSLIAACSVALSACQQRPAAPEEARPHDQRTYQAPVENGFDPLPGAPATHRLTGILDGAAYRIEIPQAGWNGQLVMWAHGYLGNAPQLFVGEPPMRRHLLERGYAWAASSYSRNGYDARVGVEDTNALALSFQTLARQHGVPVTSPRKILIAGNSMGGHIAAAAVERETLADANHRVHYAAALPFCAVLADTWLTGYFAAYHLAALQLAGMPAAAYPIPRWHAVEGAAKAALWSDFPARTTAAGERLREIEMNLSGGPRPFFSEAFADPDLQDTLWSTGPRDGTLGGILNGSVADTRSIIYRFETSDGALSAAEVEFNAHIARAAPVPDANRRRRDGLRWVPVLEGDIGVPVLTVHTLGDLYVPLAVEQIYRERVRRRGHESLLVQRVVRDFRHCAYTEAEASEAFDDLVRWEAGGARPAGDEVTDSAALASPTAGCRFTRNDPASPNAARRAAAQAHYPPCPASGHTTP